LKKFAAPSTTAKGKLPAAIAVKQKNAASFHFSLTANNSLISHGKSNKLYQLFEINQRSGGSYKKEALWGQKTHLGI
jgi:hypothetical protein